MKINYGKQRAHMDDQAVVRLYHSCGFWVGILTCKVKKKINEEMKEKYKRRRE